MTSELLTVVALLIVAAIAATAIIVLGRRMAGPSLKALRIEARDQFRNWLASNGARQIGIGPGACDIVKESETIGRGQSNTCYAYTLTRFLRNRDGHDVMFKSTPRGPYVKLVEPSVARIVLKRKYVEPGA